MKNKEKLNAPGSGPSALSPEELKRVSGGTEEAEVLIRFPEAPGGGAPAGIGPVCPIVPEQGGLAGAGACYSAAAEEGRLNGNDRDRQR